MCCGVATASAPPLALALGGPAPLPPPRAVTSACSCAAMRRCVHVHRALGRLQRLRAYYLQQRRMQVRGSAVGPRGGGEVVMHASVRAHNGRTHSMAPRLHCIARRQHPMHTAGRATAGAPTCMHTCMCVTGKRRGAGIQSGWCIGFFALSLTRDMSPVGTLVGDDGMPPDGAAPAGDHGPVPPCQLPRGIPGVPGAGRWRDKGRGEEA